MDRIASGRIYRIAAIPAGTYLTNNQKFGDYLFVKYLENITTEITEITESELRETLCYLGDLCGDIFFIHLNLSGNS